MKFRYLSILTLPVILIAYIALPAVPSLVLGYEPEQFDHKSIENLEQQNPSLIFLGNSILDTRIDPKTVSEITGIPTQSLAINGSAAGIWYLQLKNIIGQTSIKSPIVHIFFYDNLITQPISTTGGSNKNLIEPLLVYPEELFFSISRDTSWNDDLTLSIYPIIKRREEIKTYLNQFASLFSSIDSESVQFKIDSFGKRQTLLKPNIRKYKPFYEEIENSFLPAIIQIAKEKKIDLVLVKTSKNPSISTKIEIQILQKSYVENLSSYLNSNGVHFIDMTGVDWIDATMFYDSAHIWSRYKIHYTKLFIKNFIKNPS
tara:strand:+ start:1340 stop:2287 length:948 start_codon:yes stop_codon:yes gene_type:complete